MPEFCRSAVIVSLYKDKGEWTECKNYKRGWKNICGILVDRVRRVNGSFIDVEQGGFRMGRGV